MSRSVKKGGAWWAGRGGGWVRRYWHGTLGAKIVCAPLPRPSVGDTWLALKIDILMGIVATEILLVEGCVVASSGLVMMGDTRLM